MSGVSKTSKRLEFWQNYDFKDYGPILDTEYF
jgi:hypothetical protein